MAAVSRIELVKVTADHPRGANEGLILVVKFRLDRIWVTLLFLCCEVLA